MKKLNNKGFAISSLLYGLLLVGFLVMTLLISLMATNRKNTSTLVDKIEEELSRYGRTSAKIDFSVSDSEKYIVPYNKSGWYKIELYGGGTYTSAIVYLSDNQHLLFEKEIETSSVSDGMGGYIDMDENITTVSTWSKGAKTQIGTTKDGESGFNTKIPEKGTDPSVLCDIDTPIKNKKLFSWSSNESMAKIQILMESTTPSPEPTFSFEFKLKETSDYKYYIFARDKTKNLKNYASNTLNLSDYAQTPEEEWIIKYIADCSIDGIDYVDGCYTITAPQNGNKLVYDKRNNVPKIITKDTYDNDGGEANYEEKWIIEETIPGSYTYAILHDGFCLTKSGNELIMSKCDYMTPQKLVIINSEY